jgi:chromosome partitioning protein
MVIIAVIAEKGGAGKTTLSLDLAVTAVQKGHKAAILDVDPQATASKWTDRRTEELPWVVPTHAVRLGAAIEQAKAQGVDFIVIDTPPHSSTDAAEAARRADVVVSPVEPHLFGLETVSKLADLLRVAGNPPSVEYIKQQGFKVCPTVIHLRAAHRHASNIGKTAAEYEADSKAAQETLQLYVYTLKLVSTQRKTDAKAESALAGA